ncbi:hypothetical protein [Streptomyces resistomycificus]|uniref:hypothetical protein n=1 Tax=Streptomyces resistomycificus TaxID=67356 RepID=UPI001CED66A9|nr:hypothetical protein [Streptomyces resistomycificus]
MLHAATLDDDAGVVRGQEQEVHPLPIQRTCDAGQALLGDLRLEGAVPVAGHGYLHHRTDEVQRAAPFGHDLEDLALAAVQVAAVAGAHGVAVTDTILAYTATVLADGREYLTDWQVR